MLSWQARILNGFFRFTMKRHGKKPLSVERLRNMTRNPPKSALSVPAGFKVESLQSDQGLNFDVADLSTPRSQPVSSVVLYLHGGGYIFGSPQTHRQVLIAMAEAFRAPVYGLDYRLAPEHPFPAAVEDAAKAYRWLLDRHPEAAIVLSGDSAGAGLAIATALGVRTPGCRNPRRSSVFPVYRPGGHGSLGGIERKSCAMFTPRGVREAAALYLAGADARDPRASPLYGDFSGLPPMLLFASHHEILRDDTLRLAERAAAAGVKVELIVRERLPHVWPVFVTLLPEARDAFATVTAFARQIDARNAA